MGKFQFRLEKLKKVRELERQERLASLAEAYHAQDILNAQAEELQRALTELRQQQRDAMAGTYLDVNRLTAAGRHEPIIKAQQETVSQQKELLAHEVERRRELLVSASRNVRALELLEERKQEQYRQEQERVEIKNLDEAANVGAWRRRQD